MRRADAQRRVVHLSDLHFGRTRSDLLEPTIAAVNAARPDLVAVSGDLTQRARHWQFREARAFLRRLDAPCLVVPGNHDVPLENLGARLVAPFRRYRRYIARDLEPEHVDEAMAVVGINTTDPLAWESGRVRAGSIERACRSLRAAGRERVQVVVAHHPFEHLPGERKALMRGAEAALRRLAVCGAQVILSGHLHAWRAAPFTLPEDHAGVLQVQAGTSLSTRLRGEANDFNLLTIGRGEVTVERFVAGADSPRFARTAALRFRLAGGGWRGAEPA